MSMSLSQVFVCKCMANLGAQGLFLEVRSLCSLQWLEYSADSGKRLCGYCASL